MDSVVTASDASESGGAVCATVGLSTLGRSTVTSSGIATYQSGEDYLGVVMIEDHLGSTLQVLDKLKICPSVSVAWMSIREGWRVLSRSWPSATVVKRKDKDEEDAEEIVEKLRLWGPRTKYLLIVVSLLKESGSAVSLLLKEMSLTMPGIEVGLVMEALEGSVSVAGCGG